MERKVGQPGQFLLQVTYIEIAPDIWWQLQELGVAPGISIYLEGVKLTKSKGFDQANIAAKWKRSYRGNSTEEAWLRREPQPNGLF